MSTKTSPYNTAVAGSATSTSTASSPSSMAVNAVKIKKEIPNDEIKEFAENTMNELLGWYGFENVERLDLSAKTSRLLQHTAAVSGATPSGLGALHPSNSNPLSPVEKRRSRSRAANSLLQLQHHQTERLRNMNHNNNNNNNNKNNHRKGSLNCSYRGSSGSISVCSGGAGGGGGNESTTSDHDTRSSCEDDSKSPNLVDKLALDEKIDFHNCCWCRRPVPENAPEFLTTSDGPRYCSESCFTQSRRASFKKAKTCDWCKHVRHAVSYVDFQDGASQLQFCSDKCLNQYKMQIFCKETQAHLDMNPHLREQGLEAAAAGNGAGLITPDLWLRNCRSRSASPASTISVSPGPPPMTVRAPVVSISPPRSQPKAAVAAHKPMISVAPVSKLMSKSTTSIMQHRQSPKHSRKKRPVRVTTSTASTKSNAGLHAQRAGDHMAPQKSRSLLSAGSANSLSPSPNMLVPTNSKTAASTLSHFANTSAQDLHMSVPPLSPMLEQQMHTHPSMASMSTMGSRNTNMPPSFFATPPHCQPPPPSVQTPAQFAAPGFPPRPPPYMQNPLAGLPRFMGGNFTGPPPPLLPTNLMQTDMTGISALLAPPPMTVMVPYPIIIPLPIPIPIPLPVMDFYKAYLTPEERQQLNEQQKRPTETVDAKGSGEATNVAEEPLDFTKAKESTKEHAKEVAEDSFKEEPKPTTGMHEDSFNDEHLSTSPVTSVSAAVSTVTTNSTPSKDLNSPASSCSPTNSSTHCIVTTEAPETHCTPSNNNNNDDEADSNDDGKQKLPKFKITRLQTKRILIQQTKESECSRPLRKRKRIIDCDFQRVSLGKDGETLEEEPQEHSLEAKK